MVFDIADSEKRGEHHVVNGKQILPDTSSDRLEATPRLLLGRCGDCLRIVPPENLLM